MTEKGSGHELISMVGLWSWNSQHSIDSGKMSAKRRSSAYLSRLLHVIVCANRRVERGQPVRHEIFIVRSAETESIKVAGARGQFAE